MKKPTVDYRGFRLSRLREPGFRHLLWLLPWIPHTIMYFLTSHIFPKEAYTAVHCGLDDLIPFLEIFIVPYVTWYLLIAFTILYFMFYDAKRFVEFGKYLAVLEVIVISIYLIYPTRVDFQPTQFPRDNFFTDCVKLLYAIDEDGNACPSLHVAFSVAVISVWAKRKESRFVTKLLIWVFNILVCISTVFVKQHSALDFFWALPVCLVAEILVFGKSYWLPKFKKAPVAA